MTVAQRPIERSPLRLAAHPSGRSAWLAGLAAGLALAAPLIAPAVGLGALGAAWLAGLTTRAGWLARRTPLEVGWGLLLLGSLLGFLVSPNPPAAAERLAGVAAAATLFVVLQGSLTSAAGLRSALWLLAAAAGLGSLLVLALIRGQLPDNQISRLLAPLLLPFGLSPGVTGDVLAVNSRFPVHQYGLAYLLAVLAVVLAANALHGVGLRRARWGLGIASLALTAVLAATEARGALLALAVAAALVGGLRSRWFWGLLPAGGLLLYLLLARGIINRSIEVDWLNTRLSIWTRSLSMLGDYPLTGSGLGMPAFAETFAWTFGLASPYLVVHSHNIFIQAYAEQGLLGLVGLLLIVSLGLSAAWRAARTGSAEVRPLAAGLLGGLAVSLLYGLTDQVPTTSLGLALVAALCGLAVAAERLSRSPTSAPAEPRSEVAELTGRQVRLRWRRTWRLAFPLLTIGLLLFGVAPRWVSGAALNAGAGLTARAALAPGLAPAERVDLTTRAEQALLVAVRWNPLNSAAYRVLGAARLLRHDVPGALAALQGARETGNLNHYERTQLGRLYLQLGFWAEAFQLWQAAGQDELLEQAADELAAKGDLKGAAAARATLVELHPNSSEHAANLAKAILAAEGRLSAEEALAWFERAAQLNPEARRSLSRQIVLHAEPCRINERRGGGRFECAVFWFGLASRIDPSYDKPEVELGSVLYYRGRFDEAAEHFREAARRDPDNSSSWHQLGEAEEAAGRLEPAAAAFEQAVRVAPSRPGLLASLGRIYLRAGNCDAARQRLEEALRLEPANAVALEARGRLDSCR